jgi:hypothetical protein
MRIRILLFTVMHPDPTFQFDPDPTTHFSTDLSSTVLHNDPLKLPAFNFDADADPHPAFHFVADPDPASQNDADPDADPHSTTLYGILLSFPHR